jgi:hypothetical protein
MSSLEDWRLLLELEILSWRLKTTNIGSVFSEKPGSGSRFRIYSDPQ